MSNFSQSITHISKTYSINKAHTRSPDDGCIKQIAKNDSKTKHNLLEMEYNQKHTR